MPSYGPQQVYVIQHELGPVKIGRANDPRQRLGNIQVSSPFKLTLKKTETPHDAKAVEDYLHLQFRKYHMRGEWFDIPREERDFEIPTHIDESGRPNIPVEITVGRDMNTEWGELLDRLFVAMKVSKHETPEIKKIRSQVRELRGLDQDEDDDSGPSGPADVLGVQDDTPRDKIRCTQCGHYFDQSERGCPTCGSGSFTDNQRR